jgi:anti-sigma B factor antagonist
MSENGMALQLASRTVDGVSVLDCRGRIVFGEETTQLREFVKSVLPNSRHIVINLGDVTYVDSGGLGTLVSLYTSARAAGGDIKLCRLTQRVGDLLHITRLLSVFETYKDENEAIASFRGRAAAI